MTVLVLLKLSLDFELNLHLSFHLQVVVRVFILSVGNNKDSGDCLPNIMPAIVALQPPTIMKKLQSILNFSMSAISSPTPST